MAFYNLTENCSYRLLKQEMICDHLVVDICDTALSEKLQLDSKLTLEMVKTAIQQKEAVCEQQQTLKGTENAANPIGSIDAIGTSD